MKYLALAAAMAAGLASPLLADYPEQPIKLIVPTGAGGGMDTTARIVQRTIEANNLLPESIAIVNMKGAGGTIGTREVLKANPDGYTFGFWHEGIVTSNVMGVVDYDHNDFEIVGATGFVGLGIGVRKDSDIASLKDLLERGKSAPDTLSAATNIGLTVHFFPLLVAEEAGAKFRFVQAGGGAKRLAAVLGGHNDFATFGVNELVKHKDSGLRAIAVLANERSAALPDVPTAAEIGIPVSAQHTRIWLAPKGTPEDRLNVMRDALRAAMSNADLQAEFETLGISASFIEPDALDAQLDDFSAKIAPLVETVKASK